MKVYKLPLIGREYPRRMVRPKITIQRRSERGVEGMRVDGRLLSDQDICRAMYISIRVCEGNLSPLPCECDCCEIRKAFYYANTIG